MDLDVQLQVTDKELEEFPEENTTHSTTNRWDTHSPTRQLLVLRKETLVQPSEPLVLGKETLIQPSKPSVLGKETLIQLGVLDTPLVTQPKGSLIQPSVPVPLLLTLQPQPDLQALVQTLTPQALRYLHIGIHISQQISQHGLHSRCFSNRHTRQRPVRRKTESSQRRARLQRCRQQHTQM